MMSWYWTWRPIPLPLPGAAQEIPAERAQQLGLLVELALERAENGACFLALAHERIGAVDELSSVARIEYRVSINARFPGEHRGRGLALRAREYAQSLDDRGAIAATRGTFHLSEVIAQAGVAVLTVRADLLLDEPSPRLAQYVPVAVTLGSGPLEPMQVGLWDPAASTMVWTTDDKLSRAWHAPLAGGEMLTMLPSIQVPSRAKSGSFAASIGRTTTLASIRR